MNAEPPLASLSLTQVHYNPNDPLSHLSAYLALLPHILITSYLTLLLSTREIEILLTFTGQLACEALNWGLKRWFKEQRPEAIRHLGKGYGMPSSHAQFLWFFAGSVVAFTCVRHRPVARVRGQGDEGEARSVGGQQNGRAKGGSGGSRSGSQDGAAELSPVYNLQLHYPRLTHALLSLAAIGLAVAVSVSRVYLNYHTPLQVLVGCGAGISFSIAWFAATEVARRMGLIEWVLEWQLLRSARMRDLICEEDLVEIGWQVWEGKRRRRRSKKSR